MTDTDFAQFGTPAAPPSGHEANLAFLRERGGHDARSSNQPGSLSQEMAARLARAGQAFEASYPGQRANYGEMFRDRARQAVYYNRYVSGAGGLAAPPGQSRHESGEATDVPRGAFLSWLHGGGGEAHGLEFLKGRAFAKDPVHVQMARDWRDPGVDFAQFGQPADVDFAQFGQANVTAAAKDVTVSASNPLGNQRGAPGDVTSGGTKRDAGAASPQRPGTEVDLAQFGLAA